MTGNVILGPTQRRRFNRLKVNSPTKQNACAEAKLLPSGTEREMLIRKARQAELDRT
jgi:hypothetical protein